MRTVFLSCQAYPSVAYQRKKKLDKYEKLLACGHTHKQISEILEISKSTYYRWKKRSQLHGLAGLQPISRRPHNTRKPCWSKQDELLVLEIRQKNTAKSKEVIGAILRNKHDRQLSDSTIGRIISKNIAAGNIKPASFYKGEKTKPRGRVFAGHSQRLPLGMKAQTPHELIQIDHFTPVLGSTYDGRNIIAKHFNAVSPISKIVVSKAYSRATSRTAANFLTQVIDTFGKSISIQVDGGSEFRGNFEAACEEFGIQLYVLPPRSPKMNGCVERFNRTVKTEFYYPYSGILSLRDINAQLDSWVDYYNQSRPHSALQYQPPMRYYQQWEASQSHMY